MVFSIIVALLFYSLNRQAQSQTVALKKESDELRALNLLLKDEISIRKKVEENLEVVEQSLIQSQKLAVLGEMSAAVSHELNQPLAAMKTYLAAAKLLFDRRRTQEALSSLQRIDDLIERMSVITKQLKSHARKVSDSLVKIDLREVVTNSIAIMELNLKQNVITIDLNLGKTEVLVLGDPIRLEQVLINLIRNSLDAVKEESKPMIEISLLIQGNAILRISDNGNGIEDLDSLFEPFYTTKDAGDGLGLGLSISSSIITDYGGRLTARNNETKGAIFEIELPLLRDDNFNTLIKDN
jgi:two-component system C4-dicarboxylate transport sensor histidine kinase DctB